MKEFMYEIRCMSETALIVEFGDTCHPHESAWPCNHYILVTEDKIAEKTSCKCRFCHETYWEVRKTTLTVEEYFKFCLKGRPTIAYRTGDLIK